MSKYDIVFDSKAINAIESELEQAVQIALLNTMVRFHIVTNDLVPIDTGQLRESFEYEFLGKNTIRGEWEAWRKEFPYGAYQHEHHKTMNDWVRKSIELNKDTLVREFKETLERELR